MYTPLRKRGQGIAKILNVVVVLSLLLTPLASAFAQDATDTIPIVQPDTSSTSSSDDQSSVYSSGDTPDPSLPDQNVVIPAIFDTPTETTDPNLNTDSAPTVEDPSDSTNSLKNINPQPESSSASGGTGGDPYSSDERKAITASTKFQPDPLTGSLNYSYPLTLPPGRAKLTPDLSLQYSSQPGSNVNIIGYGWSFSIPSIQRINRTGVDAIYNQDYFYSSLDGELASSTATSTTGNYGPIAENGSFNKYTFSTSTNTWTVIDKAGTVYTFGSATGSRQDNPSNSAQIYQWVLDSIRDTNNNYIKYTYYKDAGEIYPDKILYTGNGTTDGPFEVDFLRTTRTDLATSSQFGFNATSKYLINEIDVKVNGTWVHKYLINYTSGDNGNRSLLGSITEEGQDDLGNTITLPATTFSYQQSVPGWTAASTSWNSPKYFQDYQTALPSGDIGVRLADVNGDGLPDIIRSLNTISNIPYTDAWINTGSGWTASSTWNPPAMATDYNYNPSTGDRGTRFVDVNGDGLPDILQSYRTPSGTATTSLAWINTGNGWVASSTWNPPFYLVDYVVSTSGIDDGIRFMDVNGDGLVDAVQSFNSSANVPTQVTYLNNGAGWIATTTTWTPPVYFSDLVSNSTVGEVGVRVVDVNGDGLPDILQSARDASGTSIVTNSYINNGNGGWTSDPTWNPPIYLTDRVGMPDTGDKGVRIMDVNGDGLPDIVQGILMPGTTTPMYNAWLNTGHGWSASNLSWAPPVPIVDYSIVGNDQDAGVRDTDFDGNNTDDIFQSVNTSGTTKNTLYTNNSKKVDLLTQVVNPAGGKISYTYKQTPLYSATSGQLTNSHLPLVLDTVNTVTTDDGLGNLAKTTYTYSGGVYYYASPFDHKISGFNKITATDDAGNYTNTYYHTGNGTDTAHGEYNDTKAKIGKIYRIEKYDINGNLYAKQITRWDKFSLNNNRYFVIASSTLDSQYDGNGTHKDKADAYAYDVTNGNKIQDINYGEVSGNDDGSFADTGLDLASTTISYAVNSMAYMPGLVSDLVTQDQSSNKISESRHYYDGLSIGSVNKGNETKTEGWISGSTYASSTKTYDSTYGLITQQTDPLGNLTSYTLDANHLYSATTTNALGQSTGYVYDYVIGKPKQILDLNGHLYTTSYDALRRPLVITAPDPSTGTSATKTTYTYVDSNTPGSTSIEETDNLNSATSTNTYTYLDGLGRKLQERKTAQGNNTYAIKDWLYNNRELLASESLPYFASSTARTSATSTSQLFVSYTYDPLARILKTTTSVGSTTNTYDDWTIHVTDANGNIKDYTKDAFGNIASVTEHIGTTTATTLYNYDRSTNLIRITDTLGNIRNFTYDGLARELSGEDLHAPGSIIVATTTYAYDVAGNLLSKLTPNGNTTNYTYDQLNRELTEDDTSQLGSELTYTYDSCLNGVGYVCVASTTTSRVTNSYNILGLVASTTNTISGIGYTTQYAYDRQGNIVEVIYPDGNDVQYSFNAAAQIQNINNKISGSSIFSSVLANTQYSPTGQVNLRSYANGLLSSYVYDQAATYRLVGITTATTTQINASSTNALQNITYTFDPNGNITLLQDFASTTASKITQFFYDTLNRLTIASSTGFYTLATSTTISTSTTYISSTPTSTQVSYLVVGGGGGANGGANNNDGGGGGGAGEYLTGTTTITSGVPYTITIGAGGVGGAEANGTKGSNTVISGSGLTTITAEGGGYGAGQGGNGGNGGSGGGGGGEGFNGGTSTNGTPKGRNGGNGTAATGVAADRSGGGGGGSGGVGANGAAGSKAAGGIGTSNSISGSAITYAAGGLGGTASANSTGANGTANTGNGGDASTSAAGTVPGGTGGSGIVIISAPIGLITASTTGTHTTGGGNDIWTFTSGGTFSHPTTTIATTTTTTSGGSITIYTGPVYKASYSYDALGNMLTKGESATGSTTNSYTYAGTNYANPDAVTQITNGGLATSTLTYDHLGNLTSMGTTTYAWDWRNRLTQLVNGNATTTYSYDNQDNRVSQQLVQKTGSTTSTTVTVYPNKYYSISSNTVGTTTNATSTDSIFQGDTLVSTIDTRLINGTATGTPIVRYIHPDHLGSTNVVTDASGAPVQTLEYYPYGSTRINIQVNQANEARQYIGQFTDPTNLSYLNARYYDGGRGQFLSQDPVFTGDPRSQNLMNPQTLNSYSYAEDNPIINKDPSGQIGVSTLTNLPVGAAQGIKSTASFIGNIFAHPFGTANSIANTANMIKQNPSVITQGISQSIGSFFNASDADQGKMLGAFGIGLIGPKGLAGEGAVARIADDALVVRGGGLANQTAGRINESIAASAEKGVNGFSVQCNSICTSIEQLGNLGQYLRNSQLGVTTAGAIRQAGGEVVSTGSYGSHATVFGLSGEKASPLFQNIFNNPNPKI